MTELITSLTEWLRIYPQWIAVAIGLLSLVESLVMIGLIIPGVALLFATALLAGSLDVSLPLCLGAAMLGAVGGDLTSFFLGRHAHPWALQRPLFKRHPDWIERGERFFHRYGLYSVVIGRFVGPVRPVIPFVAGMLSMPPVRFVSINLLSALAWAPVYILPGYLLGSSAEAAIDDASLQQPRMVALAVTLFVVLGTLLIYLTARLLRHQGTAAQSRQPTQALLPPACGLLAFAAIALLANQTQLLTGIDHGLSDWLSDFRGEDADRWIIGITLFGDSASLLLMGGLLWGYQWRQGARRLAGCWAIGFIAQALLGQALKYLLERPRPELLAAPLDSFAFPSTHAGNSAFFFFMLAWWIGRHREHLWPWVGCALLLTLGMALTRLYLGVHWPSDLLAGALLGWTAARLTDWVARRQPDSGNNGPIHPWLLPLILLVSGAYIALGLPDAIARYQPA